MNIKIFNVAEVANKIWKVIVQINQILLIRDDLNMQNFWYEFTNFKSKINWLFLKIILQIYHICGMEQRYSNITQRYSNIYRNVTAKRSQIGRSPIEFNMFWKTPPLAGYRLADNRFPLCSLINIKQTGENYVEYNFNFNNIVQMLQKRHGEKWQTLFDWFYCWNFYDFLSISFGSIY